MVHPVQVVVPDWPDDWIRQWKEKWGDPRRQPRCRISSRGGVDHGHRNHFHEPPVPAPVVWFGRNMRIVSKRRHFTGHFLCHPAADTESVPDAAADYLLRNVGDGVKYKVVKPPRPPVRLTNPEWRNVIEVLPVAVAGSGENISNKLRHFNVFEEEYVDSLIGNKALQRFSECEIFERSNFQKERDWRFDYRDRCLYRYSPDIPNPKSSAGCQARRAAENGQDDPAPHPREWLDDSVSDRRFPTK